MDAARFANSSSGRLVQGRLDSKPYDAFVPHPLPPTISFDAALVRDLSEADRTLGELAGLGRNLPNPHLLIGPFLRREAVLSSKIEGTQTQIDDLYAFEAGQAYLPGLRPQVPEDDIREVANYVAALQYGLHRVRELPISRRLMRELHERLMAGVRGEIARPGEFRKSQNWIATSEVPIDHATFVPPPADEMDRCLDALESYINSDDGLPPLVRIGLIHYQFEAIHPFLDGNGRIGRLLISLLLIEWNLLPLPLLYLSAYLERHRSEYYRLLFAVSERGAWNEWLSFFLRGVAEQSRDAVKRAKQLQDLQQHWRSIVQQNNRSARQLVLVDRLFEAPILSIPQAADFMDVTYRPARNAVEQFVELGILRQLGQESYSKLFIAAAILDVISG